MHGHQVVPTPFGSCFPFPAAAVLPPCLVGGNGLLDPGQQGADLGVDAGVACQGAADAPGHDALQLPVADQWPARVSLQDME